ncbi:MAG TPA: TIGR00730 family Rossman fold protein [Burkholderiaceae bacterium]|nr:TIGR00730 family Rossman fold protein [Burkholderiaceae bacterium]
MGESLVKSVCLFCGAAPGRDPAFAKAVNTFVNGLAARDIQLITGGGSVGLMGVAADAMVAAGGRSVGIIPEKLVERELGHRGMDELIIVGTMHERKALMGQRADAFVAAPGGIGTMEELFEVFTWRQIGYHDKPIAILDVNQYYAPLLAFLDHATDRGLVQPWVRTLLHVETDPLALVDWLARQPAEPRSMLENESAIK